MTPNAGLLNLNSGSYVVISNTSPQTGANDGRFSTSVKIVLVIPPFDFARSVRNVRRSGKSGILPPLGVGYLAASLEEHGHVVSFVDSMAERFDVEQAVAAVEAHGPELVGISALTTLNVGNTYALASALRKRLGNIPLVMGGPHVTAFHKTILEECGDVDILIPGDGELALAELADRLSAGHDWQDIRGLVYRDGAGNTVATHPAEVVKDIDRFPHPARRIYNQALYRPLQSLGARRPATTVITSRGCPWAKCRFCYQGGEYATPYRRRSPENVADEVCRLAKEQGMRNIVFWDDDFCVMPRWIEKFCGLLVKENLDLVWSVLARASSVTREMLHTMASAGCCSVQFGFESGNQELLDLIDKGITLDQCRDAVRWTKEAGLGTIGTFILGFPTESPEMSEKTVRFACELNVDYVMFFPYGVAPGTKLAEVAAREGRVLEYQGDAFSPGYVPKEYSGAEELAQVVIAAYRRYYLRPAYIRRALWRGVTHPEILKNQFSGFFYWLGLMFAK